MRKILALFLGLLLVFSFAACGGDTFTAPDDYASVVLVTINPQFKLYLDVEGNVLAVEPVNDDAKGIIENIDTTGKIEAVVEKIVTVSKDNGFIKENATVDFKITEVKDKEVNTENVLERVKKSADESFKELEIEAQIKTSVSEDAFDVDDTSSQTPDSSSQPDHTHSFSAATCTQATTCSCGATQGEALGHNYKDGKCTVCNEKDANYTPTSLANKKGDWKAVYVHNDTYYSLGLTFTGESSIGVTLGDPLSKMEQEIQDDIRNHKDEEGYKDSYVVYEGKEYWCARGSFTPLAPMAESGNTITLTSSDESTAQIVLTRTDENTLTVKSCTQTFKDMLEDIPVGTRLTFKAN